MRTILKVLSFLGLVASLGPAVASEVSEARRYSIVKPTRLDLPSKAWEELQFIQADLQGRLFILRGSPALDRYLPSLPTYERRDAYAN